MAGLNICERGLSQLPWLNVFGVLTGFNDQHIAEL